MTPLRRTLLGWLTPLLPLAVAAVCSGCAADLAAGPAAADGCYPVKRVVDGDTFRVDLGQGREETVRRMYEITKRTPAYITVLADYARHLEEAFGPGAAPIDEIANNPANYTGISSPYRPEFQSLIQDGIAMMLDGRAAVESTAAELERQVNAILRQGEVPAD